MSIGDARHIFCAKMWEIKKPIEKSSIGFYLSERRGSNPRPLAWKANALSAELLSQFNIFWSQWRDSNPRPADYKSAALAS